VIRGVHATALAALQFYDRPQGNHRGTVDARFSGNGKLRVLSDASCSSDRCDPARKLPGAHPFRSRVEREGPWLAGAAGSSVPSGTAR